MIDLAVSFKEREFVVATFSEGRIISKAVFTDAAALLPAKIDEVLGEVDRGELEKIVFLVGPGSFTSIKIVCAFFSAVQLAMPGVYFVPARLDEALQAVYGDVDIFLRCNAALWHCFQSGEWQMVSALPESKRFISMEGVSAADILDGLIAHAEKAGLSRTIEPFYGLNTF